MARFADEDRRAFPKIPGIPRKNFPGIKSPPAPVLHILKPPSSPLENATANFDQTILPHLDAAYNLARWLIGNERDAEDVTQEACLRAFKFFSGFRGGDARSWLLTIVRRTRLDLAAEQPPARGGRRIRRRTARRRRPLRQSRRRR